MKFSIKKLWIIVALLSVCNSAIAYTFEVDGIYYNLLSAKDLTCEVTYNPANISYEGISFRDGRGLIKKTYPSYKGDVIVPKTVMYLGKELTVTSIGEYAFLNCRELKSLSLPSTISNIAQVRAYNANGTVGGYAGAFDYCGIERLTVGNAYSLRMFNESYGYDYTAPASLYTLVFSGDFRDGIGVDFSKYYSLITIKSEASIPPKFSSDTQFTDNQYTYIKILVPENALSAYQSASVWRIFWKTDIIKPVEKIELNYASVGLQSTNTIQLTAKVFPEDANFTNVTWSSSDSKVAAVYANGLVEAIAKGNAIVFATAKDDSGVVGQCLVSVDVLADSIQISEKEIVIEPRGSKQLEVTIKPNEAYNKNVVWSSDAEDVATVDQEGNVTAHALGIANISVKTTDGSDLSASCRVIVGEWIKSISIIPDTVKIEEGKAVQLSCKISPENAVCKNVIWSSDAENVVTVDEQGNVMAHSVGIANISVKTTDGSNLSAFCHIEVGTLVEAISIIPDISSIAEDKTLQLSYNIFPESATYKAVVWTSENNDIATVNAVGLVSAVSSGKVKIRATATDGSDVFGECELTVNVVTTEDNSICYQRNSTSTLKVVANPRKSYSGDLLIPSVALFNGREMSVTEIDADAFVNCDKLTRLVIPSSVTKIQESTFKGCSNLIYVKICNGSSLASNLDILFSDSPIEELYIGSDRIAYNSDSRLLGSIKRLTLGNNVSTFPPAKVFNTLQCFVVEDGEMPIIEPEDYCTKTMSLINKQTIRDPNTLIYYRSWYLITYEHLFPIIDALEKSILDYIHIGREVQGVEVDTSKTQEKIPTTAGSRYQEFGYKDEIFYQYREEIATKNYNRNPIESVSFEQTDIELNVGEYVRLAIIFNPKDASFTTVEYTSSDENIATVDAFGNVMKLSEGEAIITATTIDGSNLSTTCKIKDKASGISNVAIEELENFDVYSLQGVLIRKNCKSVQSLNLAPGIYILRYGNRAEKIRIQ